MGEDDTSLSKLKRSMSHNPTSQDRNHAFEMPHTLNSFKDTDVDDYNTDEGGKSTNPEKTGNKLYFGQAKEKGGDYMVNAMDVEELRRHRQGRNSRMEAGSDEVNLAYRDTVRYHTTLY